MTAQGSPDLGELIAALGAASGKLAGREGDALREHLQQLAQILALNGPDGELRARAAGELEQVIGALVQLMNMHGAVATALRGTDLRKLADGLRTFVDYLKQPSPGNEAKLEQLVTSLQGAPALRPVALDELKVDGTVEALAIESARRQGLRGSEAKRAAERMKREVAQLIRELEQRAQLEASRAETATEMERLIDRVIGTGTPLGEAVRDARPELVAAFRSVDLAHMAQGLRAFALWLSSPAEDPVAHVAALKARFAEVLGPATAGDPARSDDERRADFERDIKVAIDRIFRGHGATPPS